MAIRRVCEICGFAALRDSYPPRCWRHADETQAEKIEQKRVNNIIEASKPEEPKPDDPMSPLDFDAVVALLTKIIQEAEEIIEKMKAEGHTTPPGADEVTYWEGIKKKIVHEKSDALHISERRKAFQDNWAKTHPR